MSEYESDSDSEAESMKDGDNVIAPPTWYMLSGQMIRFNTTLVIIYLCRLYIEYSEHAPGWCISALLVGLFIYVIVVEDYAIYLYPIAYIVYYVVLRCFIE